MYNDPLLPPSLPPSLPSSLPPSLSLPRICDIPNEFIRDKWTIAECLDRTRELTPFEQNGNNILFTLRTTASFHKTRLPVLFQTWLANVNRSNVIIVTDKHDTVLQYRAEEAGMYNVPPAQNTCA